MLDVHPPHEAAHTWKDFLIHVGTICVGLLIAVGLEQAVEYFHHRHQVKETREALRVEEEKNIRFFALESEMLRQQAPVYRMDLDILMYLRSHPGAAPSTWPGKLDWRWHGAFYPEANWATAKLDGVVEHMPTQEVQNYDDLYRRLERLYDFQNEEWHAIEQARRIMFLYPDPAKASPVVLDESIKAMSDVLVTHSRVALAQDLFVRRHANFGPGNSLQSMDALLGIPGNSIQQDEIEGLDKRVLSIQNSHP